MRAPQYRRRVQLTRDKLIDVRKLGAARAQAGCDHKFQNHPTLADKSWCPNCNEVR